MAVSTIEQTRIRWQSYLHPRYWHTWLGMGLLYLLSHLPLKAIWLLGALLGSLLYYVFPSRARVVRTNIARCFPELDKVAVRRLARRNLRETAQAILASGIAWWAPAERLAKLVTLRNEDILEQALKGDKPVILLVGHFAAIEIGGMYLASRRPIIDIYRKPRNALLDAFVRRCRTRFNMGTLVEFFEGIKPVLRALKLGETFYYLPDQDFGRKRSVFVPFFGIQTATLPALGKIAKLANAVVIPCFTRQLPRGAGYEVIFKAAVQDWPQDELAAAAKMNRVIEAAVREMPEQYFWLHKRFKTRPEGEPRFYR